MPAGVSASDYLDPDVERPPDAGDVMLVQSLGALADVRLRRFAVVFIDEQRRYEKDAALGHAFEMTRILVEIAAVLNRSDAGLDRDVEPAPAERVAHDSTVERVRLLDQRLHLVEIEGAIARAVTRPRTGAAGRRAFDHVGASTHHAAHHRAYRSEER